MQDPKVMSFVRFDVTVFTKVAALQLLLIQLTSSANKNGRSRFPTCKEGKGRKGDPPRRRVPSNSRIKIYCARMLVATEGGRPPGINCGGGEIPRRPYFSINSKSRAGEGGKERLQRNGLGSIIALRERSNKESMVYLRWEGEQ